jgi:TPR repeat protein
MALAPRLPDGSVMKHAPALSCLVLAALARSAAADGYPSGPGPCEDIAACQAACDAGKMASCTWGGFLVMQAPFLEDRWAKAKALFEPACKKGDTESCWQTARVIDNVNDGAPEGAKTVIAAYDRACKKGHVRACLAEGYLVGEAGDAKRKTALYKKGEAFAVQRCEKKKDAAICRWLSYTYADGYYVAKSEAKAARYRKRACTLDPSPRCQSE